MEGMGQGETVAPHFAGDVQGIKPVLDDRGVVVLRPHLEGGVAGVQGSGVGRLPVGGMAAFQTLAVAQPEGVAHPAEVAVQPVKVGAGRADAGRIVVGDRQADFVGAGFADTDLQPGFARLQAGSQFGVELFDQRILLQELQAFLEFQDVQRYIRVRAQAVLEVGGAQPGVADDVDFGQAAFDDLNVDDAVGDLLIGEDGPGVEVAALDVVQGQLAADFLQFFGGEGAVFKRRGDFGQFRVGRHGVAGQREPAHEDVVAGG